MGDGRRGSCRQPVRLVSGLTREQRALAACRDHDPSLWFSTTRKNDRNAEAVRICAGCPIREACLEHSLEWASDGIWGGLTAEERSVLRRERKITLRAA